MIVYQWLLSENGYYFSETYEIHLPNALILNIIMYTHSFSQKKKETIKYNFNMKLMSLFVLMHKLTLAMSHRTKFFEKFRPHVSYIRFIYYTYICVKYVPKTLQTNKRAITIMKIIMLSNFMSLWIIFKPKKKRNSEINNSWVCATISSPDVHFRNIL